MAIVTTTTTIAGSFNDDSTPPTMEVYLSRPVYRLGTAVVGTIRLLLSPNNTNARDSFASATVRIVGKCRIDPRWHNAASYAKQLYREHPHLLEAQQQQEISANDTTTSSTNAAEICLIWATNQVELMELPERPVGDWRTVKPKPLQLPPANPELYFTEDVLRTSTSSSNFVEQSNGAASATNGGNAHQQQQHEDASPFLEEKQLAFTFRADLPVDLPPSVSLTCCRYYYEVVVDATTADGKHKLHETIPFFVSTASQQLDNTPATTHGFLQAMAHSAGLPCHVSADDIHAPQGQTAILSAPSHSGNPRSNNNRNTDAKTLRVADPQGNPCCILTAFGSSTMVLGGELLLQFDFPATASNSTTTTTNCRLVSACLEGKETAIREYGNAGSDSWTTSSSSKKNHRTRTFLFDTASAPVEPGFTESVPLSLQLPLTAGVVSVQTDLVHVEISCRVDLTIESTAGGSGTFTNLRLDLPIRIVHSATAEELQEEDEPPEEEEGIDFHSMLLEKTTTTNGHNGDSHAQQERLHSFDTKGIFKELKILSLLLVEKWNLVATPQGEKYHHSC